MRLTRRYARRLLREGKARIVALLKPTDNGTRLAALDRLDLQRTDHYPICEWEVRSILRQLNKGNE